MKAVIKAISNIIDFLKLLINLVNNIVNAIILTLSYFIQLIPKILVIIATLPSWLLVFPTITLGITIAYFIINRKGGTR